MGKGQRERERIILYVKILKIVSEKGIWKAENRGKRLIVMSIERKRKSQREKKYNLVR